MKIYGFNDYDQYNSLKVSPALWLLIVYSMRHGLLWLGLASVSLSHAIDWISDFTDESHWAYFLCGAPVLVMLIALNNRVPKSGAAMRQIWHNGQKLLASSLALHLLINLALTLTNQGWNFSVLQVMFLSLDVIGFIYLYRSQRVKDVFADFPSAVPLTKTSRLG